MTPPVPAHIDRCVQCGRRIERASGPGAPWRDGTNSNICPNGGAHHVDTAGAS